jgi:hypothetical protein
MLRNLKKGKDHVLSNRYFPRSRRHRHFVHCYRCLGTWRRGQSPRGRGLRRGRRNRGRRWSSSSAILCSATVRCSPIHGQACVWILSQSTLQKTLSDHATSLVNLTLGVFCFGTIRRRVRVGWIERHPRSAGETRATFPAKPTGSRARIGGTDDPSRRASTIKG